MINYSSTEDSGNYLRIEKAIQFIENNYLKRPNINDIAETVHLSKFHFERLFKEWAGISPLQFMQFLTLDYTKKKLQESENLLNTALSAGLSGSARLHDLYVSFEAMTPGEYKNGGKGLDIYYGICDSPFGFCLIAKTKRGICHLSFFSTDNKKEAVDELSSLWPRANILEDFKEAQKIIHSIFNIRMGSNDKAFHLHIKGTNFQVNVWKALITIPEGVMVSYQDVASLTGNPKACRSVASAIARNPVAFLIPCHRVISKSGKINQYRWGSTRKKAILGWEAGKYSGL